MFFKTFKIKQPIKKDACLFHWAGLYAASEAWLRIIHFLTYTSISLAAAVATEASSNPYRVSLSSITIGFLVSARVPPLSPSIRNYSISLTRERKIEFSWVSFCSVFPPSSFVYLILSIHTTLACFPFGIWQLSGSQPERRVYTLAVTRCVAAPPSRDLRACLGGLSPPSPPSNT